MELYAVQKNGYVQPDKNVSEKCKYITLDNI